MIVGVHTIVIEMVLLRKVAVPWNDVSILNSKVPPAVVESRSYVV